MGALFLVAAVSLTAVPMADAWPYAVKRLPDGTLEYAYDLSLLRISHGHPDAVAAHGEDAVKAFLTTLPKTVTVRVAPGAGLDVSAGRGLEWGELASAFRQLGDGPYTSDNPLAKKPAARLRAPLDPEEPKLLASADAITFQVRQLEDGALAAAELDTEKLRKELFDKLADKAVGRFKTQEGDAREGALALAARLLAARACLDERKLRGLDDAVAVAARVEIQRLVDDPDNLVPPVPWSWTAELTCAWVRTNALAQPFPQTREGTAAVLTFLDLLASDPALARLYERVKARRDRFVGSPGADPLDAWRAAAKAGPAAALDLMNEFIESLAIDDRRPPALLAAGEAPYQHFLRTLKGAELSTALEELAAAIQDGRLTAATTQDAPWPVVRDAALAPLVGDSLKGLQFDSVWRGRLRAVFAEVQGGFLDGRGAGLELTPESQERSLLSVRLEVPPSLDVEPLPELYGRLALSLERLVAALEAERLNALVGINVDGSRAGPVRRAAQEWVARLKGLAVLATPNAKGADGKEVAQARRFLASWQKDAAAGRDVRQASAAAVSMGRERSHAAIVGVSRRELVVTFASAPQLTVVGNPAGFTAQAGEQRYLVPVLVTAGAVAPATRRALELRALRTALDAVGHDATRAEGAFSEALHH